MDFDQGSPPKSNLDSRHKNDGLNVISFSQKTILMEENETNDTATSSCDLPEIKNGFGNLLEQVWSGEWSTLRPVSFKDKLEIFHPQFRGAHQQDCQVYKLTKVYVSFISFLGYKNPFLT